MLDRTLLIVESKSATLSPQGLRGAPHRARRHIKELVTDPSEQSARLAQLIAAARDGDCDALKTVRSLGLDPTEIRDVIRISVTLDDLSVLSSAENEMKAAGWMPEGLELAATLNLGDFACVADILVRPSQFLHYFSRRSEVQRESNIFGFELDFLGLYLATAFNLAVAEGHTQVVITDMSQAVDRYYHNLDLGLPIDRPKPRMAPMFEAIVDQLEARRPTGWTTMVLDLLSFGDADDQSECEALVEQARQAVLQAPVDDDELNVVALLPPGDRDVALAFHVFPHAEQDALEATVSRIAQHVIDESGRSRCLVISRMVERWNESGYEAIALGMVADKAGSERA